MPHNFVSPAELKKQYSEKKCQLDFQKQLWAYLVIRPLSFYVAPIFIWLGFTANQVTLFGGVVLVAGLFSFVASTSNQVVLFGAILINIWYLLDFVDGTIARYNNQESLFGEFLDWFIGTIYWTVLPFVVAVVLYRTTTFEVVTAVVDIPQIAWFGIAGLYVFSRLLRTVITQKVNLLLPKRSYNGVNMDVDLRMIAGAISSFKAPLLLITAISGGLDLWLLVYTIYSFSVLGPVIILQISKLK